MVCRMRGKCYCGDSYGRYGVKLPNRTAGLTGASGASDMGSGTARMAMVSH